MPKRRSRGSALTTPAGAVAGVAQALGERHHLVAQHEAVITTPCERGRNPVNIVAREGSVIGIGRMPR